MDLAFGIKYKNFLPRALVLFHGEWYLENKIWALGVFIAIRVWMFPGSQWPEPENVFLFGAFPGFGAC